MDIREGRLKGFSLAREALGELAAVPLLVARLKGKDLSRYEEQEFEELSGDFRLQQGVVRTDNLTLRYRYSTARLRGTVRLEDGGLDLSGTLTLAREVDEELGGTARERVIPIAGIGGTVTEPRVKLDRDALIALTQSYLGQSQLREKLEERVGSEGAEVIEGVLEQIFKRKR